MKQLKGFVPPLIIAELIIKYDITSFIIYNIAQIQTQKFKMTSISGFPKHMNRIHVFGEFILETILDIALLSFRIIKGNIKITCFWHSLYENTIYLLTGSREFKRIINIKYFVNLVKMIPTHTSFEMWKIIQRLL